MTIVTEDTTEDPEDTTDQEEVHRYMEQQAIQNQHQEKAVPGEVNHLLSSKK